MQWIMVLPVIGETLQLLKPSPSLDIPDFYKLRFKRYGSVFKTSFGGTPMVVSMDMEFNRFVFRQNDKLFQSWYPETAMTTFGKKTMATGCGQIHKHMRTILAPLYAPKNLEEAFISEMERIIAESIRLWATKPSINVKEALTDQHFHFRRNRDRVPVMRMLIVISFRTHQVVGHAILPGEEAQSFSFVSPLLPYLSLKQNTWLLLKHVKNRFGSKPVVALSITEANYMVVAEACKESVWLKALQCASTDEDFEYMSRVPYSSAVGSLMCAMVCSHPDLSYAMSLVSRYMANPGKEHWKVAQRIFRYLRGTTNACLKFGKTDKGLTGYMDSDFAANLDKRRSLRVMCSFLVVVLEFEMKDLGAAKKILGMEITRDINSSLLFLSQQSYIKKVLHRFNMHDANSVSTPIAPHFKLSALQCASTDKDFEYMSRVPYSSVVGSLMCAMVCSHPDLSYAMSLICRYMANPGKEHWKVVQRIFRYLRGTTNACLKFGKTDKGLTSYVDSDFAADLDKRRSLRSKKEITTLKKLLSSEFEMKDLGAAKKILGMEITRDKNSSLLFLSQQSYIKKVLHRFNMHDANSVSTPIAPHFKLSALQCASTDKDFEYMSRVPYSSVVGSLMCAMVCSHPDLSYAMSLVSRYMANPGKEHWKVVQRIFRYLRGTTNACLKFGKTDKGLTGYVDSDFAVDLGKRRSLTGYVFTIGGCAVCSRPDLSYAMSLVSRYTANPGKEHWKVVQWIFRYLRGTTNACLKFDKTDKGLNGYVDSNFAADLDKRRSLIGYVFTIGGCAVSWRATLQPVVACLPLKQNTWLLLKHVRIGLVESTNEDFEYMSRVLYSSVVGSLMYAMVCSRPDLSYAISLVSRYTANPGKEHWKVVQWIFRYLRGTANACLKFDKTDKGLTSYMDSNFAVNLGKRRSLIGYVFTIGGCAFGKTDKGLTGYVDSDFAADLDKRISLTGYVFTIGGCAVSWMATLQPVVALSTTEAEYMAVAEGYKESVWLKDYKTRFLLWQVKMRAILAQSSDLDEALDGFRGKGRKSWTAEEKRKDRKTLSLIHLHLHNDILQEVLQEKTAAELCLKLESICMYKDLTSKMHVKMKLFTHKLQEGGSVMNHLSIFKEIVADLVSMEVLFDITVKKIIGFEPDSPMTKELRKNYDLFFKGLISFPLCVPGTKFYQSIQESGLTDGTPGPCSASRARERVHELIPGGAHGGGFVHQLQVIEHHANPLIHDIGYPLWQMVSVRDLLMSSSRMM
ncbi:unnamed protein product [Miscanthus lutarioriparius]|uniref:Reverse transcriptase Ty1/copia-type domain-containing protein n=1 Tax=Miscanthus lutarioriparius TaxID=422564 RepID=A0A811NG59_9POAL|nr:unnamed protein product [Miscanthus lutarioriparius]